MSYTLVPYLVDLPRLREAVGSRNEALLDAMARDHPDWFAEESDDGEVSVGKALRHLVMGEEADKGSAHQYGYALERLCQHLGEELEQRDMWESIRWEVLEATGADELLTKTGAPVPLPPIDNFPTIGFLEADRIAALVAKLGDGSLVTAAPSGRKPRRSLGSWLVSRLFSGLTRRGPMGAEDVRECLDEYEGWLREAARQGKSLVFFYY